MIGYFVYFYYNKEDELLYVGQSVDVGRRWREHTEIWKNEVSKIGIREYPDDASMDIFEYYYITRLSPKYNIARLHRGVTTFDIPDSTTLTIYSLEDFLKKYASYQHNFKEDKPLSFEEELVLVKGKTIIDVTEINLFDKKWWKYDLDRVIFRYENLYLSTYPFLFSTYNKNSLFRTSNLRIEALHEVMNTAHITSEQKLTIREKDDHPFIKTAKTACNINPLFLEVTHKHHRTGCENIACSFSIPIFDNSIVYDKIENTTTIEMDFSKIKSSRKYIKGLDENNLIIYLPEILPTT